MHKKIVATFEVVGREGTYTIPLSDIEKALATVPDNRDIGLVYDGVIRHYIDQAADAQEIERFLDKLLRSQAERFGETQRGSNVFHELILLALITRLRNGAIPLLPDDAALSAIFEKCLINIKYWGTLLGLRGENAFPGHPKLSAVLDQWLREHPRPV